MLSHASDNYYYSAKKAVYRADDYIHNKSWQGGYRCSGWTGTRSVAGSSLIVLPRVWRGVVCFIRFCVASLAGAHEALVSAKRESGTENVAGC